MSEITIKKALDLLPRHIKFKIYRLFENFYLRNRVNIIDRFKGNPSYVYMETNHNCNLQCSYCSRQPNTQTRLPLESIKSIISQLSNMGFRGTYYPYLYNEPLTDSRIFDICNMVPTNNKLILSTNGVLLTEDKVHDFIRAGVDEIRVTAHENTPDEEYNRLTNIAKDNPDVYLIDFRKKHRKWALQNRGGTVEFNTVWKFNNGCEYQNGLNINSNGSIILCCNDVHNAVILGNIYKDKIKRVWFQSQYVNMRRKIRKGDYTHSICLNCGYGIGI